MIRLVLSDVDGTLLPFGARSISSRTHVAIEGLRASGIEFGLATGRNIKELTQIFQGDRSVFRTGVLANGMRVRAGGEDRMLSLLEHEPLEALAELAREMPGVFLSVYAHDDAGALPVRSLGCTGEELEAFCEEVYAIPAVLSDEVPDYPIAGATIASCRGQEALDAAMARAREAVPQFDYLQPAACWCDILPRGMSKGSSLPVLLGELGLSADEVLFFGDADNDLPLMGALDNTVAVANATPAAAAAARWHVGASEDDGVAAALEELARATRAGETPSFMRD